MFLLSAGSEGYTSCCGGSKIRELRSQVMSEVLSSNDDDNIDDIVFICTVACYFKFT